jgi:hypothetical protein
VGARFSAPDQTGPGAYPASCTKGTGSFPGVKRPGRRGDHPSTSSAEVKERVELYFYYPSGSSWPILGRTLPYLYLVPCVLMAARTSLPLVITEYSQMVICSSADLKHVSLNKSNNRHEVCLLHNVCRRRRFRLCHGIPSAND